MGRKKSIRKDKHTIPKKQKNVYEVIWEDIETFNSVSKEDAISTPPELVHTYGVIVYKDLKYTIVMTHDSSDNNGCDFVRILTPCVKKIRKLQ